jgi:hypothetical protein
MRYPLCIGACLFYISTCDRYIDIIIALIDILVRIVGDVFFEQGHEFTNIFGPCGCVS